MRLAQIAEAAPPCAPMEETKAVARMVPHLKKLPDIPAANETDCAIEQLHLLADLDSSCGCNPACPDCALFRSVAFEMRGRLLARFRPTVRPINWGRG